MSDSMRRQLLFPPDNTTHEISSSDSSFLGAHDDYYHEFEHIDERNSNQGANDLDWPPQSSLVDLRNTRSIGDLNSAEVMALNLTAGQERNSSSSSFPQIGHHADHEVEEVPGAELALSNVNNTASLSSAPDSQPAAATRFQNPANAPHKSPVQQFSYLFDLDRYCRSFQIGELILEDETKSSTTLRSKINVIGSLMAQFAPSFTKAAWSNYHISFVVYMIARFCFLNPSKGYTAGQKMQQADDKLC
jgi:hypothetical protein